MPSKADLLGRRFGRLLVIEDSGQRRHRKVLWRCLCDCGNEHLAVSQNLIEMRTRSCGCLSGEPSSDVHCHNCGVVMRRKASRIKRARYLFCSNRCKQSNRDFNAFAALRNGDAKRGRMKTHGLSYVKYRGRHLHRVLAEQMLGRPLKSEEHVHHIDGDKKNNALDNLQVLLAAEHLRLHSRRYWDSLQ